MLLVDRRAVGVCAGVLVCVVAVACGSDSGSTYLTKIAPYESTAAPNLGVHPPPSAVPTTAPLASTDAFQGKALFQQHCVVCHQADASGGLPVGTATSADLRQRNLQPLYHNDTSLLTRAILDGNDQDGADLDPVMPRWRGTLSEADAQLVIAYLKTLP